MQVQKEKINSHDEAWFGWMVDGWWLNVRGAGCSKNLNLSKWEVLTSITVNG